MNSSNKLLSALYDFPLASARGQWKTGVVELDVRATPGPLLILLRKREPQKVLSVSVITGLGVSRESPQNECPAAFRKHLISVSFSGCARTGIPGQRSLLF